VIEADGVRVRRAEWEDVDFLVELLTHDEVEPFLSAAGARDRSDLLDEIDRSLAQPDAFGRFVIEVEEDGGWRRAGALGYEVRNRRNRIAFLQRLAVHPGFRGRRLGDTAARLMQRHLIFDLDFHRLELEVYGFNERAIAHAERAGFVKEGVKRRAYRRGGEWVDSVLFGLTREDLEDMSGGQSPGHGSAGPVEA
jgi:RimJ/RimL family protein N-acetyltransferase